MYPRPGRGRRCRRPSAPTPGRAGRPRPSWAPAARGPRTIPSPRARRRVRGGRTPGRRVPRGDGCPAIPGRRCPSTPGAASPPRRRATTGGRRGDSGCPATGGRTAAGRRGPRTVRSASVYSSVPDPSDPGGTTAMARVGQPSAATRIRSRSSPGGASLRGRGRRSRQSGPAADRAWRRFRRRRICADRRRSVPRPQCRNRHWQT